MKSSGKSKKGSPIFRVLMLLIFAGVFVFSAVKVVGIMTEYKEGVDIYNEVRDSYGIQRETVSQEPSKKDRERARAEAASREAAENESSGRDETQEDITDSSSTEKAADEPKDTAEPMEIDPSNPLIEPEDEDPEVIEGGAPSDETENAPDGNPEDEAGEPSETAAPEDEPEDAEDTENSEAASADETDEPPEGEAEAQAEPQKEPKKWYRPYVKDYSGYEYPEKLPFLHTTIDFLLIPPYVFDFDALIGMNTDVCAWIMIKDTYVDYPVVKGADNVFYLRHAVSGALNNAGSVFADYRHTAPFCEKNTLVYAHNQRNLRMFHQVLSYKNKEYMEEHPYIDIYLPDGSMQIYRVYSCYVESGTGAYQIRFPDEESFMKFVHYTQESALYDSGVPVFPDSRILTLVTCTNEADETRVVLHAVLVEQTATFE